MFLDEPEGKSFADLNQYLGAAAPMGTAIDIRLKDGTEISAYINHSQESLPDHVELFTVKEEEAEKNIIKVAVNEIVWLKLKRHGRGEWYIGEDGVPMAKLPVIAIASKEFRGNGKIINPGATSVYADDVDFSGEITSGDEEKKDEK